VRTNGACVRCQGACARCQEADVRCQGACARCQEDDVRCQGACATEAVELVQRKSISYCPMFWRLLWMHKISFFRALVSIGAAQTPKHLYL